MALASRIKRLEAEVALPMQELMVPCTSDGQQMLCEHGNPKVPIPPDFRGHITLIIYNYRSNPNKSQEQSSASGIPDNPGIYVDGSTVYGKNDPFGEGLTYSEKDCECNNITQAKTIRRKQMM